VLAGPERLLAVRRGRGDDHRRLADLQHATRWWMATRTPGHCASASPAISSSFATAIAA
jgi:hypothetical protein